MAVPGVPHSGDRLPTLVSVRLGAELAVWGFDGTVASRDGGSGAHTASRRWSLVRYAAEGATLSG